MKSLAYKAVRPVINLGKPSLKGTLLKTFTAMKPRISDTEKKVMAIGDVGIEGEIYAGKVDFEKLFARDKHPLSEKERDHLNNQVREICAMIDDQALFRSPQKDITPEVREKIKEYGLYGIETPTEYHGLGFSANAHSAFVQMISSRSFAGGINVMVPNSLGPASLILQNGTPKQKSEILHKLATGELQTGFAATEPGAGSDLFGKLASTGEVRKNKDGELFIQVTHLDKRYSTLTPIADLPGVAIDVKDPDNLLEQHGVKPGLTHILVDRNTPNFDIGRRHDPGGIPFVNGPLGVEGDGFPISIEENVIGGMSRIGHGLEDMCSVLFTGRGISLPAVSAAGMKLAVRLVSDYVTVREQFGAPISNFEAVQKHLGEMAGHAYIGEAVRRSVARTIDSGETPTVVTAIAKKHMTDMMRDTVITGMDLFGGKGIMLGDENPIFRLYQALPIAITVEGANIMTESLIIYGQGSVLAHPYLQDEMAALESEDRAAAANDLWDLIVNKHIPNVLENADKAKRLGKLPQDNSMQGYMTQIERLSAAFNFASNINMLTIAGDLKRKQNLSKRMGDMMSHLYIATTVLERFNEDGRLEEDKPLVDWACQTMLQKAEEAMAEFLPNYAEYMAEHNHKREPLKAIIRKLEKLEQALANSSIAHAQITNRLMPRIARFLQNLPESHAISSRFSMARYVEKHVLPQGVKLAKPLDSLTLKAASIALTPGATRDRLTDGIYLPENEPNNPIWKLEHAFKLTHETRPLEKIIRSAAKDGTLPEATMDAALKAGLISERDAEKLAERKEAVDNVIRVDSYAPSAFR